MIEQVGVGVAFYAHFVASKTGKTGLTVTVDVWRITEAGVATEVVSGGSATEIGDGLYRYGLSAVSVSDAGEYVAVFKTSDSTVDAQHIPAIWAVGRAGVENLDATVSTRLPTASYTAAPSAGTVADAILDDEEVSAGVTVRQALAAAGSAADPLLNVVPGSYANGSAGAALGKVAAISNAALYSPATRSNEFVLAAAIQGALRPVQQIVWLDGEGVALNLTGATITGVIRNRTNNSARVIAGMLTVVDATAGTFSWTYGAGDVVSAGAFDVQFTATFESAPTPARTFVATWVVEEALSVPT